MTTPILKAAARILVALMLLFSLYLLARGHNEPGGGFIGGLIAAAAFALLAASHGADTARRALRLDPVTIIALGIACALGAGALSALLGDAPFTGQWLFVGREDQDGGKGVPISSILLFDLGVWLTVLGSVLSLVLTIEEEG